MTDLPKSTQTLLNLDVDNIKILNKTDILEIKIFKKRYKEYIDVKRKGFSPCRKMDYPFISYVIQDKYQNYISTYLSNEEAIEFKSFIEKYMKNIQDWLSHDFGSEPFVSFFPTFPDFAILNEWIFEETPKKSVQESLKDFKKWYNFYKKAVDSKNEPYIYSDDRDIPRQESYNKNCPYQDYKY